MQQKNCKSSIVRSMWETRKNFEFTLYFELISITYLFKYLFITEKRSLAIDFQLNYFEYFKPITCYRIPIPFSKQQITHQGSRTLSSLEQSFRPSHTPYSYKCHAFSYSIATWFAAESS